MKRTAKKLIQMKYARAQDAKKKEKQNKKNTHAGDGKKVSQNEKRTHRECNACTNNKFCSLNIQTVVALYIRELKQARRPQERQKFAYLKNNSLARFARASLIFFPDEK